MGGEESDIIYLVPHTHYDAYWIFNKEDYLSINVDILRKVIEILEKNPDYKFLIEQTYLLKEIEKRDPQLFRKISKFVKENRIEIADGEYLMEDTMLPQEETIVREILFGKKFVKKKFGVDVKVMWQADGFGLNAQLPQIYKKSGYKYVAFRRGSPENKPSEFLWEGLDGTRILAHFMPFGYRAGLYLDKLEDSYRRLKELAATSHILMPSGSGSTMPQEKIFEVVKQWNKKHKSLIKISTPSEFFINIEKHINELPVRKGEMYSGKYSQVFPDVASSRIWLKQMFRKMENLLITLEKFSTIYFILSNEELKELRDYWEKILLVAFHDGITGTGIDEVYERVKKDMQTLENKLILSIRKILNSIVELDKEYEDYGDVVVFNPLSWSVKNWVEVDLEFEKGRVRNIAGLKSGEENIDVEIISKKTYDDGSLKYARIGFVANIPALGYKVYRILEEKPKSKTKDFIAVDGNKIENRFVTLKVDSKNGIIDFWLRDRSSEGRRYTGNEIVIEDEVGGLYYHKQNMDIPIKTESGEGIKFGTFKVKKIWIDRSDLRAIVNIETDYFSLRWPYRLTNGIEPKLLRQKTISFKKKIIVYRDIPRIDFVTIVDNKHPRIRLRVRFSTPIKQPEYTCETQFGAVKRKTDQYYADHSGWKEIPSGVYPSLRWIDYSDEKDGITLINRGTPENEVRDGNIYLTLLRSVDVVSYNGEVGPIVPVPDARELKKYTFRYSALLHKGDWKRAKSYKHGYEFNSDLIAFQVPPKKYRQKRSFLEIEPDNVILTALKKAEDSDEVILRFYESEGKETYATIRLFKQPKKVEVVNLLEENDKSVQKEIYLDKNKIKLLMKPFEIVTLRLVL